MLLVYPCTFLEYSCVHLFYFILFFEGTVYVLKYLHCATTLKKSSAGNEHSLVYLLKKFSVAIQRGNAVSILGTLPPSPPPIE